MFALKKLIQLIHIAKSNCKVDQDSYEGMIESVAKGKTSSVQLTQPQLAKLLQRFKEEFGWKTKSKKKVIGECPKASQKRFPGLKQKQAKYICDLERQLGWKGTAELRRHIKYQSQAICRSNKSHRKIRLAGKLG